MDYNINICGQKLTKLAIISYSYMGRHMYLLSSDARRPVDD
jgi:hypothetical protein